MLIQAPKIVCKEEIARFALAGATSPFASVHWLGCFDPFSTISTQISPRGTDIKALQMANASFDPPTCPFRASKGFHDSPTKGVGGWVVGMEVVGLVVEGLIDLLTDTPQQKEAR